MQVIVLAAGMGSRLLPHTIDRPKCLVEVSGRSILDYQLNLFDDLLIENVVVVGGYMHEKIPQKRVKLIVNEKYNSTNMVYSLFSAKDTFSEDIIISYGDIIYSRSVLEKLVLAEGECCVVVDKGWRKLWNLRMANPLDDVESMIIEGNRIVELGKKVSSLDLVQGQFIGLIKISRDFAHVMMREYFSLNRSELYDGKTWKNMYMTSFIQLLINKYNNVTPVFIEGNWAEIDSADDLDVYIESDYINKEVVGKA